MQMWRYIWDFERNSVFVYQVNVEKTTGSNWTAAGVHRDRVSDLKKKKKKKKTSKDRIIVNKVKVITAASYICLSRWIYKVFQC